jgi:hypothetical protein
MRHIQSVTKGYNRVDDNPLLNTGLFISRPASSEAPVTGLGKPTLIVTGVARSGTSLIATWLKEIGVYMGQALDGVVNEDPLLHEVLRTQNAAGLQDIIRLRNSRHGQWGFKIPNLNAHLKLSDLALFRNPHLIVIYRDAVAVAVRNGLSEHFNVLDSMLNTTIATYGLAQFVHRANCPILLLSYEKVLARPALAIDQLMHFCGISLSASSRESLLQHVQPERAEYLESSHRRFEGRIEGVVDDQLFGWCREVDKLEAVPLEIHADGNLIDTVFACLFRADLADSGIGNGCHGFYVDLTRQDLTSNAVIQVKVRDRMLELENSGKRLGELPRVTDRP